MAVTLTLSRLLCGIATAASLGAATLPNSIANRILIKNVAIIGGGASGSHAALRLKEDYGQSVIVVEKEARLGGHVSTYLDPATGRYTDYGVNSFNDYGPARAFFTKLKIDFIDFVTGAAVNFTSPAPLDMFGALGAMYGIFKPYERLFTPSYSQFPAPASIPADLLLPFGEFVTKYHLEAAVPKIFEITGHGAFGIPTLESFLGLAGAFVPASGRNSELYDAIATRLGDSVLYSSTVAQSLRNSLGVVLWVKSSVYNQYTLVIADKLLIAIEPTTSNIEAFNPSLAEKTVFNKFQYSTIYAGIVSHPSLPENISLVNTLARAAPENYLSFPKPNFAPRFDSIGSNLFAVAVVGTDTLTPSAAKDLLATNINKMVTTGVLPASSGAGLDVRAWAVHGAMHARVSASDIRGGFISQQRALQSKLSTWYTGAAFGATSTSILWAANDEMLPGLVAA